MFKRFRVAVACTLCASFTETCCSSGNAIIFSVNDIIGNVSFLIDIRLAINIQMIQPLKQQIHLDGIFVALNQNCYFHSYFLNTFPNTNFLNQFGANADPMRITQLLIYWPLPMKPLSFINLNNLACVLAYFQPARRLYISEPALMWSNGS